MALDPSISLQATTPKVQSFADMIAPFQNMALQQQQIAASKQAVLNAQAQNPGIQAQSMEAQRIAKRNQAVQDITSQFKTTDPDTGEVKFDSDKASTALAGAGFWQEGAQVKKDVLDQQALAIQNEFNKSNNPTLVAEAKKKLDDNVFITMSTIASHIPNPDERKQFLSTAIPGAIHRYGIDPNDARIGTLVKSSIGPQAVASAGVTPMQERQQAVSEGSLGVAQGQLGLASQQQAVNFEQLGATPEGRDPNSRISQTALKIASDAGIPVSPGMSLFDMHKIPGFDAAFTAAQQGQQTPTATRAAAVQSAVQLGATIQNYNTVLDSLKTISKDYVGTKPGTIGSAAWNKFLSQNPQVAGLETAVQVHNSTFPNDPIDPANLTIAQIQAKLQAGKAQLQAQQKGQTAVATTPRLPSAQPAPAPSGKTVMMVNQRTGKSAAVPIEDVDRAKARGLTIMGGK